MQLDLTDTTIWNLVTNMKNTLLYYIDSKNKAQNHETVSQYGSTRLNAALELIAECEKQGYKDIELTYLKNAAAKFAQLTLNQQKIKS